MRLTKFYIVLATLGLSFMNLGAAQAQNSPFEIQNQPNYFAVGVGMAPDYVGSDDYNFVAAPAGKYTFSSGRFVELKVAELSLNVLTHDFLVLGPMMNYRFGRDDDVDDRIVKLMSKIDGAFEIGAIAGLDFKNKVNPRYRFRTDVRYLHDVSDAHDGFTVNLSTRYWAPISKMFDIGVGAGLTYGSGNYMNTYFGVDSTDAARSGLTEFNAGDGLRDFDVNVALVAHLSKSWHIGSFVKYQRLLTDAADSPVVSQRGSDNQFIGGLGIAYSW